MLFGKHHVERLHDGGLTGLVLTMDDHDAGFWQLIQDQVLNAADVIKF